MPIFVGVKHTIYIYIILSLGLATGRLNAQHLGDYLDKARSGDRVAQYNAGVCYKFGYGTEVDSIEAYRWFRRSAEQGYADAQTQMGVFFHDGYAGLEPDSKEAAKWHAKAAVQGSALSQYLLGRQYLDGDGTAANYNAAFLWLDKAAEQNLAMANTLIGLAILEGRSESDDHAEANRRLRLGAEGGDLQAADILLARFADVCPKIDTVDFSGNKRLPEDFGYESYRNGCYFGEMGHRGYRNGSGIYLWDSDTCYVGEWDDDERSGYGVTDYGTSRHYGLYDSSSAEGNGVMIAAEGHTFAGLDGCHVYAGEFSNSQFNGTGTLYSADGQIVYYGTFRNGRPTSTFPSTEHYDGYRWEVQECEGGESYCGETIDGVRNGLGIYRWADGAIWFGAWSNGSRNGDGIYIAADGRTVSGTWIGNELQ